jgi:hypothetical protein
MNRILKLFIGYNIVKFKKAGVIVYAVRWRFLSYKVYLDLLGGIPSRWYKRNSRDITSCLSDDLTLVLYRYEELLENCKSDNVVELEELEKILYRK